MPSSVDEVFDALGNPVRRKILRMIYDEARPIGELAQFFEISRPAVSKHVKILEQAELVEVNVEGRERIASLRRDGFSVAETYLAGFWGDVLDAFSAHASSK